MRTLPIAGIALAALLALTLTPRDGHALGWGARLGLHGSNVVGGDIDSSLKFGFQGGLSLKLPIGPVVLAPEVLYVNGGYKYETAGNAYNATLSSAAAELLVRFRIPRVRWIHVTAGPRLAYLLAGSVESPQGEIFNIDVYNRFSAGITAGVGYLHQGRYLIEARYSRDLTSIVAESDELIANQFITLIAGLEF